MQRIKAKAREFGSEHLREGGREGEGGREREGGREEDPEGRQARAAAAGICSFEGSIRLCC